MLTCKICGCEISNIIDNHYIARDVTNVGLGSAFGSQLEPAIYDAIDCLLCGCQNIIQERKRAMANKEIQICPDEEENNV